MVADECLAGDIIKYIDTVIDDYWMTIFKAWIIVNVNLNLESY